MIFERGFFNRYKDGLSKQYLLESIERTQSFSSTSIIPDKGTTVFISYSHDDVDTEELEGIIAMFRNYNIVPYISCMNNKLNTKQLTSATAKSRDVIKFCNKFILLATNKAIESFYCNWEVGIGDVCKYKDHIAILPIKELKQNDNHFKSDDYLKIYSSIEYFDGTTTNSLNKIIEEGFYVRTPLNESYKINELIGWLIRR